MQFHITAVGAGTAGRSVTISRVTNSGHLPREITVQASRRYPPAGELASYPSKIAELCNPVQSG
jgi:hypothetical protein